MKVFLSDAFYVKKCLAIFKIKRNMGNEIEIEIDQKLYDRFIKTTSDFFNVQKELELLYSKHSPTKKSVWAKIFG